LKQRKKWKKTDYRNTLLLFEKINKSKTETKQMAIKANTSAIVLAATFGITSFKNGTKVYFIFEIAMDRNALTALVSNGASYSTLNLLYRQE